MLLRNHYLFIYLKKHQHTLINRYIGVKYSFMKKKPQLLLIDGD